MSARRRLHSHSQQSGGRKVTRPQKALGAKTGAEAIERALDPAISERQTNALLLEATERFVQSGITIKDVYGKLDG
jgi:hypothetical protein